MRLRRLSKETKEKLKELLIDEHNFWLRKVDICLEEENECGAVASFEAAVDARKALHELKRNY